MKHFDVIAVGNATVDVFLSIDDENKHIRLDEKTKEICLKHGDKIPIDRIQFSIGGNAANVSIGLSRLSLKTAIVAEIGQDEFSEKITNTLDKEGVDNNLVIKSAGETSPFSAIVSYKKERTIFSENSEMEHDFSFKDYETDWIYLTSLSKKWKSTYEKTLEFAKKTGAKIVFNPGVPQVDAGENHISKILENTQILIVNKEEAARILDKKIPTEKEEIITLLKELKAQGPKISVITDGNNGSYSIDENEQYFYQPIKDALVVEKTGAGDAFSAAFLAAIINSKSVKEALFWGTINAASVVGKVGSQNKLLNKEEIEKELK